MTASEAYDHWYNHTDPNEESVREDIRRGMRISDGLTDIHHHLPLFRSLAWGNILEIGVRFGVSTSAFLSTLDDEIRGHLYSVDIVDYSYLFQDPKWTFIQADSIKEPLKIKSLIPAKLDFLFIDGDHTYEGVKSDLFNFAPISETVILHDAQRWGHEGVIPAIFEYLATPNCRHKHAEFYTQSNGLAILYGISR